ncbi:MAG: hypothetical protein ACWGMZ_05215 [Thermoguttaceae bacterium]
MNRTRLTIGILCLGTMFGGCATPPWTPPGWQTPSFHNPPAQSSPPAPKEANLHSAQRLPVVAKEDNARTMQKVMDELRQIGTLDPKAQNKLLADLKQTDPALWPLVMQQFRAAIAYKQRQAQREAQAAARITTPQTASAAANNPPVETLNLQASQKPILSKESPAPAPVSSPTSAPEKLPAVAEKAVALSAPKKPADVQPATPGSNNVVSASYTTEIAKENPLSWQEHLTQAIRELENTRKSDVKAEEGLTRQARLRMLYVLNDRRDDALKPIAGAQPAMQEFWSKELYGLAMLLEHDQKSGVLDSAAASKQFFSEAVARLGETAGLVVRNLAFCTAVQSYGCFTPFTKNEFIPDQEVLLYAEIENFASESTPKGYHTALKSSYQIFDGFGHRVAEHSFSTTEEYCKNPRRDFFIGFHLRMPQRINPGKYTLKLTIEDETCQKVGQSSLEFSIKSTEK